MKAVLLVSHGSRSSKPKEEVAELVKVLKFKTGVDVFEFAFLEIEDPSIPEGLEILGRKFMTLAHLLRVVLGVETGRGQLGVQLT